MSESPVAEPGQQSEVLTVQAAPRLKDGFGEVTTHVEFADGSELDLAITGPARTKRERVKLVTRLQAAQKAAVTGEDE